MGGVSLSVSHFKYREKFFYPKNGFAGVPWQVAETATRLITEQKIPPLIIVGIDNTKRRIHEYIPYKSKDPRVLKPMGTCYPDFLQREVMPLIAERYPIQRGPENTGLGGSSLGGLITLYTQLAAPGVFVRRMRARHFSSRTEKFWTNGAFETGLRASIGHARQLETILRDAGLDEQRLKVGYDYPSSFQGPCSGASMKVRRLMVWSVLVENDALPAAAQPYNEAQFKGMKWRDIGPFRGGRVLAVTGVPGSPFTYYFGSVSGGVWRTTNGGVEWQPISDGSVISSIGAIAVSESNPNVIYVGTGESCLRGNISYGDGVYKTSDGGKTWQHIGLKDTQHIARVWIDPRNPDHVMIAALGHAYGPNAERGVFRSTDGGKTWDKVLYKDDKSGAIDSGGRSAQFECNVRRSLSDSAHAVEPGERWPGQRVVSLDRWRKYLEASRRQRAAGGHSGAHRISVSGADSNRVYALIESKESGLYRSDDGGESWSRVNDDQRLTQRAWYFTHIFADPKSADTVYMLNTGMFRSTDGGKSLNLLPAPHGDHHGFWIDPQNTNRMINSNDGGATISVDGGKNWSTQYNQPTAQFYHVAADNDFLYKVYGAQQDNSTVGITESYR